MGTSPRQGDGAAERDASALASEARRADDERFAGSPDPALNLHAPAPDDPAYRWHACQRHLAAVRFPVSETIGHVRIRLSLR